MPHSFLKNYFCYTFLLLFSHFLILFGSGFLPFGSFWLTLMTDSKEEAPHQRHCCEAGGNGR